MLLAETNWQTYVMLAGIVVVIFFLMRANAMRQRQQRSQSGGDDDRHAARAATQIRDQLDELMVQLEELTRVSNAKIDTRCARIEALIADADERIRRLEELVGQAESSDASADPTPSSGTSVNPEHAAIYALAEAGKSPVQIAAEVGRDVGEVELILALRQKS
jgi:hypothetical protein